MGGREEERLALQSSLDSQKTQAERNRLGQFATPSKLARDTIHEAVTYLEGTRAISFMDPAFGTGSFFSALLDEVPEERVRAARGFEIDPHYAGPTKALWEDTLLDLQLADFTGVAPPAGEADKPNLVICNPPYVRHHHIINGEKIRLRKTTEDACGSRLSGLAGLYCYFIGISHLWMQRGAVGAWLVPSEFMDVNYGQAVKKYLLNRVTLLRIHRFDPNDVQFEDALVSSAVVFLRNVAPTADHVVSFTFGGSLRAPKVTRMVTRATLQNEPKWTRFPLSDVRDEAVHYRLSDLFTVKRGIATGDNGFFILTAAEIKQHGLPLSVFRPILPSPRYVSTDEIEADEKGNPVLDRQLYLLDCRLPEEEVQRRFPTLWAYLEKGSGTVSERYLCRSKKVWYSQERRPPAPILCTYIGRSDTARKRPFRFILNHSKAVAANVYLLLYPKATLQRAMRTDKSLLRRIWAGLNDIRPDLVLGEGRTYGGGLHKLEPRELGSVDASPILEVVPELRAELAPVQANMFESYATHK